MEHGPKNKRKPMGEDARIIIRTIMLTALFTVVTTTGLNYTSVKVIEQSIINMTGQIAELAKEDEGLNARVRSLEDKFYIHTADNIRHRVTQ